MRIFRQILIVLFLFSLGSVSAKKTKCIYKQKKECHICGKKFNVKIDGIKWKTIQTGMVYEIDSDSDFNYAEESWLKKNCYSECIYSCPKCHYSDYYWDFSKHYSTKEKEDISLILKEYENIKIDDLVENDIAIKIIKYKNNNQFQLAVLNLFNSYLLDSTQIERKREYQRKAINHFEAVDFKKLSSIKEYCYIVNHQLGRPYKNKIIRNEELLFLNIQYLIGELCRRVGEFDKAISYFDKVLEKENIDIMDDVMISRTRCQKKKAIEKEDIND